MTKDIRARRATKAKTAASREFSSNQHAKGEKWIEYRVVTIDAIRPYNNNPRKNEDAAQALAEKIRAHGWTNPVQLDPDMAIVAGDTRYKSARILGMTDVPCVILHGRTKAQLRAIRLQDNRSGEDAEWDVPRLRVEMSSLRVEGYDLTLTGWSPAEIKKLLEVTGTHDGASGPEIAFTDELHEEHQYIVLYFDNTLDWQTAQSTFKIKAAKALDAKEGYVRKGVGRIVRGADVLKMIDPHGRAT